MKDTDRGTIQALVIEFARANESGIYLPYKQAELHPGESAVFGTFYNRAVVVENDQVGLEIRDGVADVVATLEDGKLRLHSLADKEERIASYTPGTLTNATYVIDEKRDLVYYGAIGTTPSRLKERIESWQRLMPRGIVPNKN